MIKVVTALFDIGREKYDGRTMNNYLEWFGKTLQLDCSMVIYTEAKFVDFINKNRGNRPIKIVIQSLEEVPWYPKKTIIEKIISSKFYKEAMKDTSRIECNLPEYNVIQYSKFGWLKEEALRSNREDYLIWMDAGCSRFFGDFDLSKSWPKKNLDYGRLTIQGNINFSEIYPNLIPEEYCWDNECILVGTLFGGGRDFVIHLKKEICNIFTYLEGLGCVNNEQFALAIFAKLNPSLCNIHIDLDGTHLPLFKFLS